MNSVFFQVISNRKDGIATYAAGALSLNKATGILSGNGPEYYNNRLWNYPATGNYISVPQYPFDPKKTDNLILTLDPSQGTATITLPGNVVQNLGIQCQNGILFGFADDSAQTMYVISLTKSQQKIPT